MLTEGKEHGIEWDGGMVNDYLEHLTKNCEIRGMPDYGRVSEEHPPIRVCLMSPLVKSTEVDAKPSPSLLRTTSQ